MQTVQPLRRLAVIAEILSRCSGRPHSIQNNVCSPSRNLCPIWQVSTSVIGPGHQVTGVGFAYQISRSISAVRYPMRREMLASRAKLVRRSRFAPAAKPPVSLPRAAPRRSVSHSSQHSGGCNQQASWPITVSASCKVNTSSVQSGCVIACQRRECAA